MCSIQCVRSLAVDSLSSRSLSRASKIDSHFLTFSPCKDTARGKLISQNFSPKGSKTESIQKPLYYHHAENFQPNTSALIERGSAMYKVPPVNTFLSRPGRSATADERVQNSSTVNYEITKIHFSFGIGSPRYFFSLSYFKFYHMRAQDATPIAQVHR